ncbi:MAG: hypothetical protein IPH69_05330 [Bacteroidales bacterium]|nr:hypothetical protein [Bacteroidales bacterium]
MRLYSTIFVILFAGICQGQTVIGKFSNSFGESIYLKEDSTFEFTWLFDLASSWTNGKWQISNDTIYIKPRIIYDTLEIKNNGIIVDTLVLSSDTIGNKIDSISYISSIITGGGQTKRIPPSKLYLKNKRLYLVQNNGKINKRREDAILTRKSIKPII